MHNIASYKVGLCDNEFLTLSNYHDQLKIQHLALVANVNLFATDRYYKQIITYKFITKSSLIIILINMLVTCSEHRN